LSKEEEYLPSSHFVVKGKNIISEHFRSKLDGDMVDVNIVFGLKKLD